MGLFDKIKDNAKTISMKAIEATREYDEDFVAETPAASTSTLATTAAEQKADKKPAAVVAKEVVTEVAEEITHTPIQVEAEEKPAPKKEEPKEEAKEPPKEEKEEPKYEEPKSVLTRRSRIMEVPKDKANYTPHYKTDVKNTKKAGNEQSGDKSEARKPESNKPAQRKIGIIDISPQKIQDPVKRAIYARERAALSALASQRRLNGTVALYATNHMNFKTRVYINRVEYSGSFGKNVIPVDQIAWVKLRSSGTGVILETIDSKRIVVVIKPSDRLAFADAVLKVQDLQPKKGKFKDTQTVRIDQLERFGEGVDEIEKLAKLYDKGILTQDEFDSKKKQILGI